MLRGGLHFLLVSTKWKITVFPCKMTMILTVVCSFQVLLFFEVFCSREVSKTRGSTPSLDCHGSSMDWCHGRRHQQCLHDAT